MIQSPQLLMHESLTCSYSPSSIHRSLNCSLLSSLSRCIYRTSPTRKEYEHETNSRLHSRFSCHSTHKSRFRNESLLSNSFTNLEQRKRDLYFGHNRQMEEHEMRHVRHHRVKPQAHITNTHHSGQDRNREFWSCLGDIIYMLSLHQKRILFLFINSS